MAVFPRRYGIYFADLNPTTGGELRKVRPVVVVSQNERNRLLDTVVVCPLTSTLHPQWRSRIQISCAGKASPGGRYRNDDLPPFEEFERGLQARRGGKEMATLVEARTLEWESGR